MSYPDVSGVNGTRGTGWAIGWGAGAQRPAAFYAGGENVSIKSRSYTCTVHAGHGDFREYFLKLARRYDEGLIDYAAYCVEVSKTGRMHLQGFVIFNESLGKDKPTDHLGGSWAKARSLTGARDYIMREGIHYLKSGIVGAPVEFGDWVDAGYNINIKFRKQYQFARMVERNWSASQIANYDPAGMLLVGQKNVEALAASLRLGSNRRFEYEPYYYIGLENFRDYLRHEGTFWAMHAQNGEEE